MNKPDTGESQVRPAPYVRPQVERLGSWKGLTETPMGSIRPLSVPGR